EGKDLFGTGGASLERRLNQPPGAHGRSYQQRRRESDYARRLREKQAVKRRYGLRESQFRRFYAMAEKTREPTGPALLKLLERRLDNVVYRLGWARTRPQARQFVNHGHVEVDGQRVNIPSYIVEPGERVSLSRDLLQTPELRDLADQGIPVPEWLERADGTGHVVREPRREEIDADIEEQLVVEFYSR
ncbi:MAG TPA: 30S ribosomal protein S4, partial [Anaerolineae bacterium]|nr:30S ribosomal protein S4 [Anaerolineae bacterium]